MTRKTSDHNNQSSNAQTPNPESGDSWWSSPYNPLRKEYWVVVFTSDDWRLRRIKWGYIMMGVTIVFYLIFVVIPSVFGN